MLSGGDPRRSRAARASASFLFAPRSTRFDPHPPPTARPPHGNASLLRRDAASKWHTHRSSVRWRPPRAEAPCATSRTRCFATNARLGINRGGGGGGGGGSRLALTPPGGPFSPLGAPPSAPSFGGRGASPAGDPRRCAPRRSASLAFSPRPPAEPSRLRLPDLDRRAPQRRGGVHPPVDLVVAEPAAPRTNRAERRASGGSTTALCQRCEAPPQPAPFATCRTTLRRRDQLSTRPTGRRWTRPWGGRTWRPTRRPPPRR